MERRIAFVHLAAYGYFNTEAEITGGGAERQLYMLAQELRSDFDVHFVVGDYGQPRVEDRNGVTLHRAYRPRPDTNTIDTMRHLGRLFRAMHSTDADLFVLRGSPRKAIVTYWIARVLGADWVYNVANDPHVEADTWSDSQVGRRLFGHVLCNAAGIIAQTEYQRDKLKSTFGIDSTVVPNGYPPAVAYVDREDRSYFLWVGRLNESQKQPHRFLDLADRLPDKDFKLVGPARDQPYLRRLEDRIEAQDNVQYLGPVDPDEIHSYYQNAIALVNTSLHEGFPNTFLEAWRVKTPVLSLHVDPGRFVDEQLPEAYGEGDFERFVALAETLATDQMRWNAAIEHPYNFFEANLTIESVAARYGAVLERALRG